MKKRRYGITQCMLTALLLASCISGCSIPHRRSRTGSQDHAFIGYWPPPKGSVRLRLAVKDNIDLKGVVTTAGSEYVAKTSAPATSDAKCMAISRARNVQIVG